MITDPTLAIVRAIASLCFTLGLIVILGWAWKRYGQPFSHRLGLAQSSGAPTKRLDVIESKRLNTHTTLHLIRLDDTEHLIATTAAQTTLITSHKPVKSSKLKP